MLISILSLVESHFLINIDIPEFFYLFQEVSGNPIDIPGKFQGAHRAFRGIHGYSRGLRHVSIDVKGSQERSRDILAGFKSVSAIFEEFQRRSIVPVL